MGDDPFVELIDAVVCSLDQAGIGYALTGSIVSGIYGEPVSSLDVDFIVKMDATQAQELAGALPRRFYRSDDALVHAARTSGMAHLVDMSTGLKVDLSCIPPSAFRDAVFARRVKVRFMPDAPEFHAVTAEDIILMKLDWRRETLSAKQWQNALSVVRTQGAKLDWAYLFNQARSMNLEADLIKLRDEAGV